MAGSPVTLEPAGFDTAAASYDATFADRPLGRILRARVWDALDPRLETGSRVLDIACGTGVDATWMARRGVEVTAIDGSPEMVARAAARASAAHVAERVDAHRCSLQELAAGALAGSGPFDGALSNFGGLNAIPSVAPLAAPLAELIRPGGWLVIVAMGPYCPWEVVHFALRGRPRTALRRLRPPVRCRVGDTTIPVWYPSSRQLAAQLSSTFGQRSTASLELLLPPTYLAAGVERRPRLLSTLVGVERVVAPFTRGLGVHYIATFERL
jgi:SAM-dependent methyltransferase